MRKFLLLIIVAFGWSLSPVKGQYIGLENQVPAGWSTDNSASLSMSSDHYKLGTQSLRWDWTQGATLTVTNPPNLKTAVNTYKGGMMLWVYNEVPVDRTITFQFGKGSNVEYHFEYGINFKGWRACWIRFKEDMSGPKSSKDLEYMKIVAPSDVAAGSLFFDRMIFPSDRIHDRVTPDKQLPYINPDMNSNHWAALWHWYDTYAHDIVLSSSVTAQEQEAFDRIGGELEKVYKGSAPSSSMVSSAKNAFNAFQIRRSNNKITGRPYVSDDEYDAALQDVKMDQVGPVLKDLAKIYYHHKDAEAKQMFYDLLDYVMDQGLNVGSGMGTNHHYGYNFRDFPPAIFLMRDVLKADGKLEEASAMLSYWAGVQEYRLAPKVGTLQGLMDSWNTTVMPRLIAVMTMEDSPEKARELKAIKRWMDISLKIVPGSMGGIKEDGSGFHHGGLYPAYCNGGYAGIGTFLRYVNGTCFALSNEARINFGKALMAMRNYSNRKDWGFGISGRHPLGGSMSNSVKNAFAYLAKSGNPHTGAAVWEDVAAAYMRLESASTAFKQEFAGMGISAEGEPNGNYTYNYGALGIHRRNSWMVSIKGYNKYVWGSEIYTNDNRYGRYQSYGTIQVMGTGNPVSSSESGFVQDGWDWNRYPGATSIHLPLDLLESPYSDSYMDKSSEGFTGASNLEGENGIFGMKLRESSKPNFTGDHKANKSVFCFEDRIICLGSDVANTNAYHNTETTLFQVNLKNQSTPVYVDGSNAVSSFPYDNSLSEDQNHWLMDPVGNGYWVRQGSNVKVSRSVQDSRHNKTKAATQGSFATAWINHGAAPDSKTYEYVILPSSNLQAVQDFSSRMEAEETAAYKVLQQDRKAHIVWDRASNTTGYVFFELNSQVNNEFVKGITAPGLVMIKASQDKKELSLSLCDPDLHFPEVAYTSAKPSQESLIELTLKGNWEVSQNNSNCKVLLQEDTQTRFQFTLKDGIPQAIKLKKAGYKHLYRESFEVAPGDNSYQLNTAFETSSKIYFGRYAIADVNKYYLNESKMQGVDQDWFIAGADVSQSGTTAPVDITLKKVSLESYQDLKVRVSIGSLITPKFKFDAGADSLLVEYQANGAGEYKKIGAFYGYSNSGNAWHGALGLDEDFDGVADGGDLAEKFVENGVMKDFTFDIPEENLTSVRVRIRLATDHYYEGISIDNVRLLDFEDNSPKVTAINILSTSESEAQIGLVANSTGTIYWMLLNDGDAVPSFDEVKTGTGGVLSGKLGYSVADQEEAISMVELKGSYRLYAVLETQEGNSRVKESALLSIGIKDERAPQITSLNIDEILEHSVACSLVADEMGSLYWMVRQQEDLAPTAIELQNGTSAVVAAQGVSVNANEACQIRVEGLNEGKGYKLYSIVMDAAGNISEVLASEVFNTLITGLPEMDQDLELVVFGRDGRIVLQAKGFSPNGTSVAVFDLTGRMLSTVELQGGSEVVVPVSSGLGVYIVRWQMNGEVRSKKILLTH